MATEPLTPPNPDGALLTTSPKLEKLYTEITSLTMVEVSEFTELLKVRLNLKDIPMGAVVSAPVGAQVKMTNIVILLLCLTYKYTFIYSGRRRRSYSC